MKNKGLKIPVVIIAIGLIIAVAAHFLTSMCKKPTITAHDFEYSVTYKLDGETKTIKGVYTCQFKGFGNDGIDPQDRNYQGEYKIDGNAAERCYTIAQKDGIDLYIVTLFNDSYLMGDIQNDSYDQTVVEPNLEAEDKEGNQYDEANIPDIFEAEIVSWEYPKPIENSFVFAKFSWFHPGSMGAMLLAGLLTLLVCMLFVKKDAEVIYCTFDKMCIVLNFVAIFFALPIISLAACLIQAYPTGPDWIYQAYLCIPPIIPFTVAASVSLRRKGFKKGGFFIQFLGPVVLVLIAILEYIL